MLLAEVQATVSLDRLSPKVIIREQTRAPWRHELAMWLHLYLCFMYILYMCLICLGQKSEAPERRSRGRSPRA
jgi:hypothetical protein